MTDDNSLDASPAGGAPALPEANADQVASPTTTDEATEGSPTDDAGTEKPTRDENGRFQGRIDKLTWEKSEERRLREAAERERDFFRAQAIQAKPEPQAPAAIAQKEPTLEEHGWDEAKFKAAYVDYTKAVARAEAEAVIASRERELAERARAESFKQKESAFKAKTPDYEAVAYYAPISNEVAELVRESDIGPEVAYFLGKNPALAQQISQLPERAAAREIGRIEARLSLQKEAPPAAPPPVSKAPPPPPKVEATEPAIEKDPSQMSDAEWYRYSRRLANLKQNQRKR